MIFKFIWIIGACIRNPSIFKLFKELKRNESLTANELNNLQLLKLKNTPIWYVHSQNNPVKLVDKTATPL